MVLETRDRNVLFAGTVVSCWKERNSKLSMLISTPNRAAATERKEKYDRKREEDDAKLLCEENVVKGSQADANPALSTIPLIPVPCFVCFAQGIVPRLFTQYLLQQTPV